jgi:hypothetical protein
MADQRVQPSQPATATIAAPNSSQMIANTIRLRVPGCTMPVSLEGELAQLGGQCAAGFPFTVPWMTSSIYWSLLHPVLGYGFTVMFMTDATEVWVLEACALPLGERPLRLVEFDALFASGLTAQERLSPTVLRWTLDPRAELTARDLTAREMACCSFFQFDFTVVKNAVQVDVAVPSAQVKMLDALATRAAAGLAAA